MRRRNQIFSVLLALSIILLSGCSSQNAAGRNPEPSAAPSASAPAPAAQGVTFEGTDMEGNAVTSDILSQSKLTMINVWATYCNPCLREMPDLGELAGEYGADEFRIVGVVSDVMEGSDQKTLDYAADLVEQTGADYPHLLLNESLYYALLTDVAAVPTTFFIDENGVILDTVVGSMKKSAWEEKINDLLEKE